MVLWIFWAPGKSFFHRLCCVILRFFNFCVFVCRGCWWRLGLAFLYVLYDCNLYDILRIFLVLEVLFMH